MKLSFFVEGEPQPWPKKQYRIIYPSGRKPYVHTYPRDDGGKAAHWIETIVETATNTMLREGLTMIPRPIGVHQTLEFVRTRPKSNKLPIPTTRPDRDNFEYLLNNTLEGIVYEDDSLIYAGPTEKRWAKDDEEPGVYITIRTEGED